MTRSRPRPRVDCPKCGRSTAYSMEWEAAQLSLGSGVPKRLRPHNNPATGRPCLVLLIWPDTRR